MNKFRKRLKEVGMEKEFIQWLQKPQEPREFRIGDKVRVTPSGTYGYTGPGSEGTILEFDNTPMDYVTIEWYKVIGGSGPHAVPCTLDVHRRDIKLI